jgi:PAS domain S-box-containing protein
MKRDAEGNPVSVFGTHTDITEIKQAEESLRRSEGKYRNLFETMAEGVVYQDAEGNITSANPAAERILGLSLEQMQGKTSSDPRWKAVDEHGNELPGEKHPAMVALRTGKRVENHVQGILIPEKNEYVWILVNSTPQFSEGRDEPCQVYSTFTDITERQKLQAQFAQAQKMESVGRLAGGVAHDFNNVLMGVMGYADLCRETVGTDHPVRPWLDEIVREARRSANLTGQLLAFARKQTIAPQVLDLNDAVGDMLKMLRRLIGEDIDLAWQPGAELWPVRMDPGQVNQILANLCVNARDAIEGTGKVTIETGNVSIDQDYCRSHAYFQPGEYVMLAVSDDGCGMDRQTMDSIFEPFFTTKGVGEGTGLGLATVYGIVKQSEGFINVYSEPGRGTTFRIYLRRVVAETAEKAHERPPESQLRGTETVLLVEDEKSIRVTLSLFLEGLGYTVLTADSPGEGLRLAAEHGDGVDLLVTDVVMPGMSGRELAEELAPDYPAMGVLYMSGYTANVIAHRGILEENVHFLSKPVSRDALARKVREVLDGERIPTQMDPGSGPVDT